MKEFIGDFESTTEIKDCRVWAFALCDLENTNNIYCGKNIDDFMGFCSNKRENYTVLFHNLKFDSQFIISWLFKNGFRHTTDTVERREKTFNTLISDRGLYYQIEVIFSRKGKNINKVTFHDSYKLLPMKVKDIAKSFGMPMQKGKIDYEKKREIGYEPTEEEWDYIKKDVQIVAEAVKIFRNNGFNKMTIGANAFQDYKNIIGGEKVFNRLYPKTYFDWDIRQSYRGGYTYLNPKYKNKIVKNGIVLDINSLYPHCMKSCLLPFGDPIFFKGKYPGDKMYPLYVQNIRCQFELKEGKIPTIQIKYGYSFRANEYLITSGDTEVVLCLNSVDLELFLEQYDVYNLEYISGWKFKATKGLFTDYIDKWSNNKIQAKKDGNHGLYLISKLFLNSLYGKFGTDTRVRSKIPYLGEDNEIHYKDGKAEIKGGIYIAMASFITSYARKKTITSAQRIMDNNKNGLSKAQFVYADTDSLHIVLNGEDETKFLNDSNLDISDTKLGAWKFETKFNRAKFLRQKCYIENSTEDVLNPNPEYNLKITVAGMPTDCHKYVNFDNFNIGASYKGKKQPKIVPGGVVLSEIDFTIKRV